MSAVFVPEDDAPLAQIAEGEDGLFYVIHIWSWHDTLEDAEAELAEIEAEAERMDATEH